MNQEVVVEINYGGIVGCNSPWIRGSDPARLLPFTQVFWDESDSKPGFTSDGRLLSSIRTFKMARTYRNVVLTYISGSETAMAECLAFNQTIGFAGVSPLSDDVVKYIGLYRRLRHLYVGAEEVAPVAVLRSYASITYNNAGAGLSAILIEQALIQAKIPFQLITDEHLARLSPASCKVLILPNTECLSEEQLQLIERYVTRGGGLVATEGTGLYDDWRRVRVEPGLRKLLDGQQRTHEAQSAAREAPAEPKQKSFGSGRTVFIPEVEFDGLLPSDQPYFTLSAEFWKRPKNWKAIIDAVLWASGKSMPITVDAPEFVAANLLEQTQQRRRIIHFVNYGADKASHVDGIAVRCATPEGKPATAVRFYSPDREDEQAVTFRLEGAEAIFSLPSLRVYGVAAVSW